MRSITSRHNEINIKPNYHHYEINRRHIQYYSHNPRFCHAGLTRFEINKKNCLQLRVARKIALILKWPEK